MSLIDQENLSILNEIIINLTYYTTKYLFEEENVVLSHANHNKPDTS